MNAQRFVLVIMPLRSSRFLPMGKINILGEFKSSLLTALGLEAFLLINFQKFLLGLLKVLDGIDYVGAELRPGEHALEIGSSPGGATYALLEKGLSVEGIDPGEMSEVSLQHPKFFHHHQSIQHFKAF